eukprot:TRINITY_DN9041_c0_g1_i1.p1 TRINITY_DN9041_c0_g1~~TRINITY_DN9041_c0_g1_i1.p1  ORF type:complete len:2193 (+),score=293.80 TRINITY_DN9041_c0_g1_i1:284-6862(+)
MPPELKLQANVSDDHSEHPTPEPQHQSKKDENAYKARLDKEVQRYRERLDQQKQLERQIREEQERVRRENLAKLQQPAQSPALKRAPPLHSKKAVLPVLSHVVAGSDNMSVIPELLVTPASSELLAPLLHKPSEARMLHKPRPGSPPTSNAVTEIQILVTQHSELIESELQQAQNSVTKLKEEVLAKARSLEYEIARRQFSLAAVGQLDPFLHDIKDTIHVLTQQCEDLQLRTLTQPTSQGEGLKAVTRSLQEALDLQRRLLATNDLGVRRRQLKSQIKSTVPEVRGALQSELYHVDLQILAHEQRFFHPREARERDVAALKIQSRFRGHRARAHVGDRRAQQMAATRIQAQYRGYRSRREVETLRKASPTGSARLHGEKVLVFTAIPGAAGLNEQNSQTFFAALEVYNRIMRQNLTKYAGFEERNDGDAYCLSFPNVASAFAYCLDVQQRLNAAVWPAKTQELDGVQPVRNANGDTIFSGLRARMGITRQLGPSPDVLGATADTAAHLCALAKGGEILMPSELLAVLPARTAAAARAVPVGQRPVPGRPEPLACVSVVPAALCERAVAFSVMPQPPLTPRTLSRWWATDSLPGSRTSTAFVDRSPRSTSSGPVTINGAASFLPPGLFLADPVEGENDEQASERYDVLSPRKTQGRFLGASDDLNGMLRVQAIRTRTEQLELDLQETSRLQHELLQQGRSAESQELAARQDTTAHADSLAADPEVDVSLALGTAELGFVLPPVGQPAWSPLFPRARIDMVPERRVVGGYIFAEITAGYTPGDVLFVQTDYPEQDVERLRKLLDEDDAETDLYWRSVRGAGGYATDTAADNAVENAGDDGTDLLRYAGGQLLQGGAVIAEVVPVEQWAEQSTSAGRGAIRLELPPRTSLGVADVASLLHRIAFHHPSDDAAEGNRSVSVTISLIFADDNEFHPSPALIDEHTEAVEIDTMAGVQVVVARPVFRLARSIVTITSPAENELPLFDGIQFHYPPGGGSEIVVELHMRGFLADDAIGVRQADADYIEPYALAVVVAGAQVGSVAQGKAAFLHNGTLALRPAVAEHGSSVLAFSFTDAPVEAISTALNLLYFNTPSESGSRHIEIIAYNGKHVTKEMMELQISGGVQEPPQLFLCQGERQYRVAFGNAPPSLRSFFSAIPFYLCPAATISFSFSTFTGHLTISATAGASKWDVVGLRPRHGSQLSIVGQHVRWNRVPCGSIVQGALDTGLVRIALDSVTQEVIQELLRSISFQTFQKTRAGVRLIEVMLAAAGSQEPMRAEVSLNVLGSLIDNPLSGAVMDYREQSGAHRVVPSLELAADADRFGGGLVLIEIIDGGGEEDELSLRETKSEVKIDGVKERGLLLSSRTNEDNMAAAISESYRLGLESPVVPERRPISVNGVKFGTATFRGSMLAISIEGRKRKDANSSMTSVDQSADWSDTSVPATPSATYWGTASMDSWHADGSPLYRTAKSSKSALRNRPPVDPATRRRDMLTLLRNITYANKSKNPQLLRKVCRVTLLDGRGCSSQTLVEINIQTINDATEITLARSTVKYHQGSYLARLGVCIAEGATLFDPDTDTFNSAHLYVDLVAGGDNHDVLTLLTPEQQLFRLKRGMIQPLAVQDESGESPPVLTVDEAALLLNGVAIAEILTVGRGAHDCNFRLKFQSEVPITIGIVQYVLNCVCYDNFSSRVKEGPRIFTITLNAGDAGAQSSKVKVTVDVQGPFILLPAFSSAVVYREKSPPIFVASKILVNFERRLQQGYTSVRIASGCDTDDSLGFNFKRDPHKFEITSTSLYAGNKYLGALKVTPGTIHLAFDVDSQCTGAELQAFLRCITFVNSSLNPLTETRLIEFAFTVDPAEYPNVCTSQVTVVSEDDPTEITIPVPCLQYVIGSGAIYVASNATVTDVDTPVFLPPAWMQVAFASPPAATDVLLIGPKLGVTVDEGGRVRLGDTLVGQLDSKSTDQSLTINLLNAPIAAVQALVRSVVYASTAKKERSAKKTIQFAVKGSTDVTTSRAIVYVDICQPFIDVAAQSSLKYVPGEPLSFAARAKISGTAFHSGYLICQFVSGANSAVSRHPHFMYLEPTGGISIGKKGEIMTTKTDKLGYSVPLTNDTAMHRALSQVRNDDAWRVLFNLPALVVELVDSPSIVTVTAVQKLVRCLRYTTSASTNAAAAIRITLINGTGAQSSGVIMITQQ